MSFREVIATINGLDAWDGLDGSVSAYWGPSASGGYGVGSEARSRGYRLPAGWQDAGEPLAPFSLARRLSPGWIDSGAAQYAPTGLGYAGQYYFGYGGETTGFEDLEAAAPHHFAGKAGGVPKAAQTQAEQELRKNASDLTQHKRECAAATRERRRLLRQLARAPKGSAQRVALEGKLAEVGHRLTACQVLLKTTQMQRFTLSRLLAALKSGRKADAAKLSAAHRSLVNSKVRVHRKFTREAQSTRRHNSRQLEALVEARAKKLRAQAAALRQRGLAASHAGDLRMAARLGAQADKLEAKAKKLEAKLHRARAKVRVHPADRLLGHGAGSAPPQHLPFYRKAKLRIPGAPGAPLPPGPQVVVAPPGQLTINGLAELADLAADAAGDAVKSIAADAAKAGGDALVQTGSSLAQRGVNKLLSKIGLGAKKPKGADRAPLQTAARAVAPRSFLDEYKWYLLGGGALAAGAGYLLLRRRKA